MKSLLRFELRADAAHLVRDQELEFVIRNAPVNLIIEESAFLAMVAEYGRTNRRKLLEITGETT